MGIQRPPTGGNKRGTLRQVWRDVTRNGTRFRQRFYVKNNELFDTEREKIASLSEKVHELAGIEKLYGIYQPERERILTREIDGKKFRLHQHINPDGKVGGWVGAKADVDKKTYVHTDAMILSGKVVESVVGKGAVIEIEGEIKKSQVSESTITGSIYMLGSTTHNSTLHDSYIGPDSEVVHSDANNSILVASKLNDSYIDGGRINSSTISGSDIVKGATVSESTISDKSIVFASIVAKSEVSSTKMFGSFIQQGSKISMSVLREADVSSDPTTGDPSTLTAVTANKKVKIVGSQVDLTNLDNVTLRRSRISNCSLGNGSVQDVELEDVNEMGKRDKPFVLAKQNDLIRPTF